MRQSITLTLRASLRWLIVSPIIGLCCGLVGTAFHVSVHAVTELRGMNPWLIYLLPLAGVCIVLLYRIFGAVGAGTDSVLCAVSQGGGLTIGLIPSVFFGTVLTHLCGGSAGREGAALQMGGDIGFQLSRLFRLDDRDSRTAVLCGMAAFFTALFGTPLSATVFCLMVVTVGLVYFSALPPALLSSLTAFGISLLLGVEPTRFSLQQLEAVPMDYLRVTLLALLCALAAQLFCLVLNCAEHLAEKVKSPFVRAAVGGALITLLTILLGSDYNGAGMDIVQRAVEEGSARPEAFLLKLLFTAVTLSCGFKGGEVVPSFFVGACFGCTVSPLLGLPAGFGAAMGLVCVFCGVSNCPLGTMFLALELFGGSNMLLFGWGCAVAYAFSGYSGLYSSQKMLYDKLEARYINATTNAYHEGQTT